MNTSPTITTDEADVPVWWTDVQQDRNDLAGSSIDSWLDEEIDFLPKRTRRSEEPSEQAVVTRERRFTRTPAETRVLEALGDMADDVDGDFSRAPSRRQSPVARTGSFDVVLGEDGTLTPAPLEEALESFTRSGEIVLSAPAAAERPTVRITGHPEQVAGSRALRHRERTLLEMIGPHPDRIAFWVVLLGATLILLSTLSAHS